jgi:hypothetical protein
MDISYYQLYASDQVFRHCFPKLLLFIKKMFSQKLKSEKNANTQKLSACINWRLSKTPQENKALGLAFWREQGLESLTERYDYLRFTT